MNVIEQTYVSLLADVSRLSGLSIEGSAYGGLHWCVNDAPKLEKELLQYIEHRTPMGAWPRWLEPLRDRFIRDENPNDLRLLRQLLLFCYKAEHKHTDETEAKAIADWRTCNDDVGKWSSNFARYRNPILAAAKRHCTSALAFVKWNSIVPFHGPGAVYDGNDDKGRWSKWFTTIDYLYPYYDYFGVSRSDYQIHAPEFDIADDIVARLVSVPKDSRGPRLICVHPTEAIWIQQGLRVKMERALGRSRYTDGIWPKGHIHFDDQTVNGRLALEASKTRYYATLDLKEASDRLSDVLVQYLFGSHYRWFGCCRASYVDIGSERVLINSYAPMGNATTFPVQSLVFWSVCVATMEAIGFHQPSDVYVFGDDIIVPSSVAPIIMGVLESFGLVVNRQKSFYKGAFRESCGVDAFNGVDVTPVRWKTTYNPINLAGMQSLSSIAQRLRIQGYDFASRTLYAYIRRVLWSHGQVLSLTNDPEHGGIAEYTQDTALAFRYAYWHKDIQWFVTPVLRALPRSYERRHGWNHVLSSLTSLERTGRSNNPAVALSRGYSLNRGWARVL